MSQARKEANKEKTGDSRPDRSTPERMQKRIPIGQARDKLKVMNPDPERKYRFVNDIQDGHRVAMFEQAGYRFETDPKLVIGQRKMSDTDGEGSSIRVFSGFNEEGKSTYYYLMSISREWYEEDQKIKDQKIDELERGMKEAPDGVDYVKDINVNDDTRGRVI